MNIGIDIRVLARGTRTGVEEYTINLLTHLLPLNPGINYYLFYNAYRKVRLDYSWLNLSNVSLKDFRIPNRLLFLTTRYLNRPYLDRLLGGVDIYFNPHFFTAPLSGRCRKVITFHDLSFERYAGFFSWRKRIWHKLFMRTKKEAEEADRIIAVSHSTKNDLVNLYQLASEKVKVVYSGVGTQFKKEKLSPKIKKKIKEKYNLPEKFILYFGTIEPRKNLIGLIKAFELLKSKSKNSFFELKLVMAGARGWLYKDILKTAAASKYKDEIIFTGFVGEADKPYLYNLAELFVYPSFFEGFGFPPLEAMACGLPTIVSNNSSLPEVVGKGALMVNPFNIDDLARAMKMVLVDSRLKKQLIKEGEIQAKRFSWERCAQETLEVLLSVCDLPEKNSR